MCTFCKTDLVYWTVRPKIDNRAFKYSYSQRQTRFNINNDPRIRLWEEGIKWTKTCNIQYEQLIGNSQILKKLVYSQRERKIQKHVQNNKTHVTCETYAEDEV